MKSDQKGRQGTYTEPPMLTRLCRGFSPSFPSRRCKIARCEDRTHDEITLGYETHALPTEPISPLLHGLGKPENDSESATTIYANERMWSIFPKEPYDV